MNKELVQRQYDKARLIKTDGEADRVAVDFTHIDALIGSLCHVLDLNTDKEYRDHVKSEIKMRVRQWLTDQYETTGYYKDQASS